MSLHFTSLAAVAVAAAMAVTFFALFVGVVVLLFAAFNVSIFMPGEHLLEKDYFPFFLVFFLVKLLRTEGFDVLQRALTFLFSAFASLRLRFLLDTQRSCDVAHL